jgi:hypothetical protein
MKSQRDEYKDKYDITVTKTSSLFQVLIDIGWDPVQLYNNYPQLASLALAFSNLFNQFVISVASDGSLSFRSLHFDATMSNEITSFNFINEHNETCAHTLQFKHIC